MLRVQLSREVIDNIKVADEMKARIAALPAPPDDILDRLETEFVVETVYYANKLSGSELSIDETRRVLADYCP